jgi:hypothetical protein
LVLCHDDTEFWLPVHIMQMRQNANGRGPNMPCKHGRELAILPGLLCFVLVRIIHVTLCGAVQRGHQRICYHAFRPHHRKYSMPFVRKVIVHFICLSHFPFLLHPPLHLTFTPLFLLTCTTRGTYGGISSWVAPTWCWPWMTTASCHMPRASRRPIVPRRRRPTSSATGAS